MLTESEREWLKRRRLFDGVNCWSHYSCRSCEHYGVGRWEGYHHPCGMSVFGGCPKITPDRYDLQKAAEFEARVAAKLAGITESMMKTIQKYDDTYPCWACPANENCAGFECREALLRYARLAVEEEMDG